MPNDARWDHLLAGAEEAREHYHVPGVGIGILADGETRAGGLGVTDPRAPLEVDGDTLFQIGSISKTFTAALAALLAQRGRLDLDAPLRTYLPEFQVADATASAKVTPRVLFSHTAGWLGDYFETDNPTLASAVERMHWLPQVYPLGQLWSYNNASFYVAGRLIEVITGKTFAQAAKEELLDPLGMTNTGYRLTDLLTAKVAMGFSAVYGEGDTPQPGRWYGVGAVDPVGGISSTANDILRWARFTIDGRDDAGNEILSAASRETLRELRVPSGLGEYVGLSWFTREVDGVRLMSHGGSMRYQQSRLIIAPERGFAIIALTNSERGSEMIDRVAKAALRQYLRIEEPKPETVPGDRAALAAYEGRYTAALANYAITLEDDTLWLRYSRNEDAPGEDTSPPVPPSRMALTTTPDVLLALDPPFEDDRAEFLREGGDITWLRIGGRVHRRG
jgi:CubicO group peptidase (beta-lactamase class C family)